MGRGSSGAGGDVGKFGGGMTGGSGGATVKSSHPLTQEISRGGGGGEFANEIMNARDEMEREYGSAVKDINLHVATFSSRNVLGAYGGETLYMNQKYIGNSYTLPVRLS